MDAINCIIGRRSIRRFKPDIVPMELLAEIIDTAKWSPSYKNSQPWEVVVLSGERKLALSEMLLKKLEDRATPCPDLVAPTEWPIAEQARIDHMLQSRQEEAGIDLNSPENVVKSKRANFKFYHAPHGIYLLQDESLSEWSLFDLGLFAQSFMLAAHAKGLGCVPQAFLTDYATDIKEFLSIPAGKRLVLGISIGYPDMESPVNNMGRERVENSEFVTWIE